MNCGIKSDLQRRVLPRYLLAQSSFAPTNQPTSQHACHAEMGVWNSAFTLYVRFQTKVQHSSRRRGCVACSAEQIFNQLIRRHFNE